MWFIERLKESICNTDGFTFCIDCGHAVMHGVSEVFPEAEHRERMWHLVQNFKKGTVERFLMIIGGHLHTLGAHICLKIGVKKKLTPKKLPVVAASPASSTANTRSKKKLQLE